MSDPAPDYERIVILQLIGNTYMVTIPRPAIAKLGWMPADHLHVRVVGKEFIVESAGEHFVRLGMKQGVPAEMAPDADAVKL